jgi:hypothetical protein
MATVSSLSSEQIDQLAAELDAGRQPVVWFTPAAVGVDAGRSAKVIALDSPAEGDFIQVRPAGSTDELSFSPGELTMDRPPRRKKVPAKPAPKAKAAPAPEPEPEIGELLIPEPTRRQTARKPRQAPAEPEGAGTPSPARPRTGAGRAKQPAPIAVTLTSSPEGEWMVEVVTGKKRSVRPTSVAASSVAQAARALGGEVADAIEGALEAARGQQRARVEQLQAELEAARRALEDLTD